MTRFTCPACGSDDTYESVHCEGCNKCGYNVYYGNAHSTGTAQVSTINGEPCGMSQEEYENLKKQEGK